MNASMSGLISRALTETCLRSDRDASTRWTVRQRFNNRLPAHTGSWRGSTGWRSTAGSPVSSCYRYSSPLGWMATSASRGAAAAYGAASIMRVRV
jgi:hypothetical protein